MSPFFIGSKFKISPFLLVQWSCKRRSLRSQTFLSFRTLHLVISKLVWTPCSFLFSGSTRLSGKLQPQCEALQPLRSLSCYFHCCWHEQWNGRFRSPIACKKNDANALTEKICLWRIIWIKLSTFSLGFLSGWKFLLRWHAHTVFENHSKCRIWIFQF